ncbi:hypothetical protein Pint_23026 [Pistacia integerrima]|uniref:Uncharacterized protein n=1 Tax=Pistacia integerrima TaxID=434235 RepID=A0ACC0YIU4_9ROSI|nr:hypothetical protein Pint_23026 [Pistacia integerrima]
MSEAFKPFTFGASSLNKTFSPSIGHEVPMFSFGLNRSHPSSSASHRPLGSGGMAKGKGKLDVGKKYAGPNVSSSGFAALGQKTVSPNTSGYPLHSKGEHSWAHVTAVSHSKGKTPLLFHAAEFSSEGVIVVNLLISVCTEGRKKWANCLVGSFIEKKLPLPIVQNIAMCLWRTYSIYAVMMNDKELSTNRDHPNVISAKCSAIASFLALCKSSSHPRYILNLLLRKQLIVKGFNMWLREIKDTPIQDNVVNQNPFHCLFDEYKDHHTMTFCLPMNNPLDDPNEQGMHASDVEDDHHYL